MASEPQKRASNLPSPGHSPEGNGHAPRATNGASQLSRRRTWPRRRTSRSCDVVEESSAEHDEIGSPPVVLEASKTTLLVIVGCTVALLVGLFVVGLLPRLHEDSILIDRSNAVKTQLPRVSVTTRGNPLRTVEIELPGDANPLEETTVYPRTSGYLEALARGHRR